MEQLTISYNVWKQIVQTNSWNHYHLHDGYHNGILWTGTIDYIYQSRLEADDYGDWQTNFSDSSVSVHKNNDAIALILNLSSPLHTTQLDAPIESDGRIVVVNAPFSEGLYMWVMSHGDDLENGIMGEGEKLYINFDDYGDGYVELDFSTSIELHDGQITWSPIENWGFADEWSFYVKMPPTQTTFNSEGTGNCNLYPIGAGKNMIVPAYDSEGNPNGYYDIDYDQAVPIPASDSGYYNVDKTTDEITLSTPGAGSHYFMDFEYIVNVLKNVCCGNPLGIFDIEAYKCEWVSRKWKFVFSVNKVTDGPGEIGGWLMTYRSDTTES